MAILKNAKKKILVDAKRSDENNTFKASMRTAVKNVEKSVTLNDKDSAAKNLDIAIKRIDKATSKGVIHKNKSARDKSRLTKLVNEME